MRIVTLLTDFGLLDEYVGVMKGVILGRAPGVQVVDLTHQIAPQAIRQAAFVLRSAFAHFPAGTIHVVVVDPGVGSARGLIALQAHGHFFLAPDNGVLWPLIATEESCRVISLNAALQGGRKVSQTFHGRDILAPAAARLAMGETLEALGTPGEPGQLVRLELSQPQRQRDGGLLGEVLWVDHFGNLVTNIDAATLEQAHVHHGANWRIAVADHRIQGLSRCYADVAAPAPLAILGSRGLLEIAIQGGHAARVLGAAEGTPIRVQRVLTASE